MNGLFVIDKPGGMTSHDVVARVRRATGEKSIGHLGTLDPMATGVLPLLLGKYTRLAQFYGSHEKSYTGTIRFGFSTDTYDAEGQAASEPVPVAFSMNEVLAAAARFSGEMDQLPPPVSAKKIGGKPAYKIVREGGTPQLKTARVRIDEFAITSFEGDTAAFRMKISAGGYVRSVAHELGQVLGTGAHLASLRRVTSGPFCIEEALPLGEIENWARAGELTTRLPHPRTLLPEIPNVTADAETIGRMRNGMQINLPEFTQVSLVKVFRGQSELAGIAKRIAGTLFQPTVVLL
ncbi:tRNA pseudouridine(55) synthase TruB [Silvibacterium dinghuense]|uniref:tRNA pseudouridine synthase B n=1 Tax=Silvibacterium dinghuense TaxID=1560006 RepID=A0A4Q1SDQ8_9BACT|nr:tRNA pseudouridine(55) synthase TruB [Silvibacterium dinghuense]RXS95243.1 tRNA pseudouridine(55) synthase TruB [Silvibacterium dinghuense]GGH11777.1 tRNA pseudouridine synthase B [Silvibacterium dinghuense]